MTPIRTTQADLSTDIINFGLGQPDLKILPLAELKQASAHCLSQGSTDLLNYGPTEGDGYFLLALARFLSEMYRLPISMESLFLTTGNSQAIELICTHFTKPGDTIFVEEATYFLVHSIFEDHGLNLVEIPMDEEGMRVDLLAEKLTQVRPAFVYTIPSFHNPAVVSLSTERCAQLVQLSREHDFLVVADEVYQFLSYQEAPRRPLASYEHSENVFSLGTFSKILAPGLKLGWIQTSPNLYQRLMKMGYIYSGGSLNHFTSNIVRYVLELGLQQSYLETLKTTYRERIDLMDAMIQQHFPDTVCYQKPTGGYFFWLQFPEDIHTADWISMAKQAGVSFHPGPLFTKHGDFHNYMRLSFAFFDKAKIAQGMESLGRVCKNGMG